MSDIRDLNIPLKTVSRNEGILDTADTSTTPRRFRNFKRITYQGVVSGIGTDVVVRLEGTTNGIDYDNLETNDADFTRTTNGSFTIGYDGSLPLIKVRFKLVSFTGGTPVIKLASLRDKEAKG